MSNNAPVIRFKGFTNAWVQRKLYLFRMKILIYKFVMLIIDFQITVYRSRIRCRLYSRCRLYYLTNSG